MRFLFYLVHPAKVHLFKYTINQLKKKHTVDIIINSKDVLESLVKEEGWRYLNIFPKGRNTSDKPSIVSSAFKFILTILKLELFILKNKKYNLYITDDALVVNGWLHRVKSFIFNDNDIETIKVNKILFYFATKIVSPDSTNLGEFEYKKISFKGNKALAHLQPLYFKPQIGVLTKYNLREKQFCIVRISKLNATHDIDDNTGISNEDISKFIEMVNGKLKVIIISERKVTNKLKNLLYSGEPSDIPSILNFAKFVISDSGTMATEAAVLGVPNILINKLAKDIGVHNELRENGLQYFFDSFDFALEQIKHFIKSININDEWLNRCKIYIKKCDDLNKIFLKEFLIKE